jgi:hypothetical protein
MNKDVTSAAQASNLTCDEERVRSALFAEIARTYLRLDTLAERSDQRVDYPDVSVVGLQRAFEAVYAAGLAAGSRGCAKSMAPTRIIGASTYYVADGVPLRRGERVRINALIRGYHSKSFCIFNPPVLWMKDNMQIFELGGPQSGDYVDVVHIDERGKEIDSGRNRQYPIHYFEMFDYMNRALSTSR